MNNDWRPSCSIKNLQERAKLLRDIREFFYNKGVLEVETPLLCEHVVTDPYIDALESINNEKTYYLQTSPEYAMKRLLAAGSNSIYQICKAFRAKEFGANHNLEFTMLEWYRVGFDDKMLMKEIDELLCSLFSCEKGIQESYFSVFQRILGLNPHTISKLELEEIAKQQEINCSADLTKDDLLNLLFSYKIQPKLIGNNSWYIYNYPESQAALAKKSYDSESKANVGKRFEVFYQGLELGNGYDELQDPIEQKQRLEFDNQIRKNINKKTMKVDNNLIAALKHGLPDCAGVAMGLDRILMSKLNEESIKNIISFSSDIA